MRIEGLFSRRFWVLVLCVAAPLAIGACGGSSDGDPPSAPPAGDPPIAPSSTVFLEETFQNEKFFGDTLGLHTVLNGVSPSGAVELGVQVDLEKVPAEIVAVMTGGDVPAKEAALSDPAVTRKLIKAGAVVGVKGFYATAAAEDDVLTSVGLTCALCHVTVTPTTFQLTAGPTSLPIGARRLDGVPNMKMDAGRILSLTPGAANLGAAATLATWGPGRFDIRALNELEDNTVNPTKIPPLWNFPALQARGYALGWDGMFKGPNALASISEAAYDLALHGNGSFGTPSGAIVPPELAFAPRAEVLERLVDNPASVITREKMLEVQAFMQSIPVPAPGPFDAAQAAQGKALFEGKAGCAACHPAANEFFSDQRLTGVTAAPPAGDLAGGVRVPSLRGVSHTAPYFHDTSAATLLDAVNRFDQRGNLALSPAEKEALVEYLKSL
jgi:hypothetical protein